MNGFCVYGDDMWIGWLIVALIAFLTLRRVVVELATAVLGPFVAQRDARRREAQRLIADADREHWHAQFGDSDIATYGRHQPTGFDHTSAGPSRGRAGQPPNPLTDTSRFTMLGPFATPGERYDGETPIDPKWQVSVGRFEIDPDEWDEPLDEAIRNRT